VLDQIASIFIHGEKKYVVLFRKDFPLLLLSRVLDSEMQDAGLPAQ